MPPKKKEATPVSYVVSNGMPGDGRPHMFKYSSMVGMAGSLQMKNMSSAFVKEDKNSYWNRRPANTAQVMEGLRAKRQKMYQKDVDEDEIGQNGDISMEIDGVTATPLAGPSAKQDSPSASNKPIKEDSNSDDESDSDSDSSSSTSERKTDVKGKSRENGTVSRADDFAATYILQTTETKPASNQGNGSLPDPSKVLIVHPGSRTLRIGRSTDVAPLEIPYCIARRLGNGEALSEEPFSSASSEAMESNKLEYVRYDLKARMRILNLRGTTSGSIAAAEANAAITAQPVDEDTIEDRISWTIVPSDPPAAFFGDEALQLPDAASKGYKLRYPYRKGTFNTKGYASFDELLGDIVDIWTYALDKLDIRALDAEQYCIILLIPDRYSEVYVQRMCDLVLRTMGFSQLIVHQEGLSASFAAGLPSGCIIDIGAAKTSISCVDEGLIINDTRMVQGYGGDDMVDMFLQIAKTIQFPYKEASLARYFDWQLCRTLVEQCCAFNEHSFGVNTFDFNVQRPGHPTVHYTMKLHDEVTLPTYALWTPRVLDWEQKLKPQTLLWPSKKAVEDTIDIGGDAISAAMKQSVAHLEQPRPQIVTAPPAETEKAIIDSSQPSGANGDTDLTPQPGTPNPETKTTIDESGAADVSQSNATTKAAVSKASGTANTENAEPEEEDSTGFVGLDYEGESSKLPLEIAVIESLAQCGSDDKLKRVITNILIIGGVGNMQGVGFAMQSRLEQLVRGRFPGAPSPLVIPKAKFADSAHFAWKGISNLCKLEISSDMWIRKDDWEL